MNSNYSENNQASTHNTNDSVTMIATAKNFLSRDECQKVITLSDKNGFSIGTVGKEREKSSIRDSNVTCLRPSPDTTWLFERLEAAISQMNNAYKYDLLGFYEGVQIATYTHGGNYDWHIDLGPGENSRRKLSMSIQLSDSDSYDGGELEFMNNEQKTEKAIGTLIVFPSFLQHRVTPVISGTRQSLVAWVHGQPFR